MTEPGYVELVRSAGEGDIAAFSRLVAEFQDVVMGLAYGWLGDVEAARDVSQETFLDAYVRLAQLRDPVAFPAWLRRIVHKHCDRLTRRPRPETALLEAGPPLAAAPDGADAATTDAERRLRAAVSGLPSRLRDR